MTGLHAVETRDGRFYIVIGEHLLRKDSWMPLSMYEESLFLREDDLEFDDEYRNSDFDIVKVYKHEDDFDGNLGQGLEGLKKDNYELIWERQKESKDSKEAEKEIILRELKELRESIRETKKKVEEIERKLN